MMHRGQCFWVLVVPSLSSKVWTFLLTKNLYHGCVQGRIGILEVHARDKELEDDIDFQKVARATAGSTGAELMNLMNQAAIVTVRQGRKKITQADIFEVGCSPHLHLTLPHLSPYYTFLRPFTSPSEAAPM